MRPIEELPECELAGLFYVIKDSSDEGHVIVVVGNWATVSGQRMWVTGPPYLQIMDENNLWDDEPIGWLPLVG